MNRPARAGLLLAAVLAGAGCGPSQAHNELVVQRFFGSCRAEYGQQDDVAAAEGECGIITTLLNRFAAENPDIRLTVSTVAWPGYNQLSAQLGAGDSPDVVTMHESAIPDFQSRGLLEPMGEGLRAAGVDPGRFTEASRKGVTKDGEIWGMPFDTWTMLWHINMNYFREAGLVEDGRPVLPASPEELLAHARRFKQATGKPYLVQAAANQKPVYARNLYTFLMQQDSGFFADPKKVRLRTPEAARVVEMFKVLHEERLTTLNQDYPAATNGFLNGDGGVYLVGTWLIGVYEAESRRPDRPLSGGYAVMPYPQLFPEKNASFADGHAWVMPVRARTEAQREAAFRLMRFLAEHNYEWARTGHLPAFTDVIESERFLSLPHRRNIAELAVTGQPLPSDVERQFAIQDIIGEELAPAISGRKPVDRALGDAEQRINDLLFHLL